MTELLTEIGVSSIISQKTRNIGPKLVKYWPTSNTLGIYNTDAGPMRPICHLQIERLDGQIELSRRSEHRSGRLIIPRSNLMMMCELNQDGPMPETAQ